MAAIAVHQDLLQPRDIQRHHDLNRLRVAASPGCLRLVLTAVVKVAFCCQHD